MFARRQSLSRVESVPAAFVDFREVVGSLSTTVERSDIPSGESVVVSRTPRISSLPSHGRACTCMLVRPYIRTRMPREG